MAEMRQQNVDAVAKDAGRALHQHTARSSLSEVNLLEIYSE